MKVPERIEHWGSSHKKEAFRSPPGAFAERLVTVSKCLCLFCSGGRQPHFLAKVAATWVAPLSAFAHVLSQRQGLTAVMFHVVLTLAAS